MASLVSTAVAKRSRRARTPATRLFQYLEGDEVRPVTSNDVNDYLREATGGPFTAKDYRTWAATMAAALLLCAESRPSSQRECKRCIQRAIGAVAEQFGPHRRRVPRLLHPPARARRLLDSLRAIESAVGAPPRRPPPPPRLMAADATRGLPSGATAAAREPMPGIASGRITSGTAARGT
jgi:hypothetical protein